MFREKRIPGSIRFERAFLKTLNPKAELIVYCSNPGCTSRVVVYHQFVEHGFQNVTHYPGGIAAWEDGGYPFEGEGAGRKEEFHSLTRRGCCVPACRQIFNVRTYPAQAGLAG